MIRELTIEFNTGSWFIEAPFTDGNDILDMVFGGAKECGGKIVYLFDHGWVHTETIKKAKEREMFKEVCLFKDVTSGREFTGTFIDALEYIDKELVHYRKE